MVLPRRDDCPMTNDKKFWASPLSGWPFYIPATRVIRINVVIVGPICVYNRCNEPSFGPQAPIRYPNLYGGTVSLAFINITPQRDNKLTQFSGRRYDAVLGLATMTFIVATDSFGQVG